MIFIVVMFSWKHAGTKLNLIFFGIIFCYIKKCLVDIILKKKKSKKKYSRHMKKKSFLMTGTTCNSCGGGAITILYPGTVVTLVQLEPLHGVITFDPKVSTVPFSRLE